VFKRSRFQMSQAKKLTKAEKRDRAVNELINTEKTYVEQLRTLNIVYVNGLEKLKTITPEQHNTLFSQVKIILNFNTNFLSNLSIAIKKNKSIGQEMLNFCPYFRIYREYVNNYEQASILLRKLKDRPEFTEFDEEGRGRCNNLSISDLIVTPIQRVPRYPMLLKEIIKNTNERHPDLQLLNAALEKYTSLNKDINEGIKEQEKRNKVREIGEKVLEGGKPIALVAPARRFIMKGELWKVCRGKNKKYMFFLFNDILIYADPQGKYFKFHNKLELNKSFCAEGMQGTEKNGYPPHSMKITSSTKSFVAFADDESDCTKWLKAMQELRAQLDNREKLKGENYSSFDHEKKAPIMVPDHFFKECQVCNVKFTFVRRRHHCRLCGIVVCGGCSAGRIPDVNDQPMRACDNCMKQTKQQREVIRPPFMSSPRTATKIDDVKETKSTGTGNYEGKEGTPEASAELFQISFYHGPIPQKSERSKILRKEAKGSFLMVEADESLLLVYKAANGRIDEVKIGMKYGANREISYTCDRPRVSSTSIEQLITKKLWQPLGLTTAVRRHEVGKSKEELKRCQRAVALYDYASQAPGDLTLKKGEEIVILQQSEGEGWWTGMIGERTGLFPSTYIEVIKKPVDEVKLVQKVKPKRKSGPKKGDLFIAKYDYDQAGGEELSFKKGDKIILQRTDDSGWWLGRLQSNNKLGWFPPALVEKSKG